jgi:hypothetical protein
MRGKRRSSRLRIPIVAAVVAVAGCATVPLIGTALDGAAQALSSSDRSSRAHSQPDRFLQSWFRLPTQRKLQRPSGNSRVAKHHKTKSKPEENAKISEKASGRGIQPATAAIQNVPLPRPRPTAGLEPLTFSEAAGPNFNTADVTSAPSDCDERLRTIAVFELLPRLIGPGDCGGRDMVEMNSVVLPNRRTIEIRPTAILRCPMAESFAAWVRDEVSTQINTLGTTLRGVETYGSYECRGRNGVPDAKLSEHARGNAIDVRALALAGGRRVELTDATVAKSLREELRDSACRRFTTVLGPGADSHHDSHIHLDILERTHGYRICQWDVREPPRITQIATAYVQLASTSPRAQGQSRDSHSVTVGPWAIATNYKANTFNSCVMSRSEGELGISFVRTQDGLLLLLDSPKWRLDRGKAYSIRLSAGSRSVNTKALAESKSVTIALTDPRLKSKLRSVSSLEVHGEGDTLHVPLDGSSKALERLERCFDKHKESEANPFVAPRRKR